MRQLFEGTDVTKTFYIRNIHHISIFPVQWYCLFLGIVIVWYLALPMWPGRHLLTFDCIIQLLWLPLLPFSVLVLFASLAPSHQSMRKLSTGRYILQTNNNRGTSIHFLCVFYSLLNNFYLFSCVAV